MSLAMSFDDIDLKLLKVLHVLLTERSVTRASERLGRSQPTVSNALGRLRDLLRDDLLVRGPDGLSLTPRAQAIQQPLREAMALVESCLSDDAGFDPSTDSGMLRVSAPDRLGLAVVPPLIDRLRRAAPQMRLQMVTADRGRALELLDEEVTDVAIGTFAKVPHHFHMEIIFMEGFQCVFSKDHPILTTRGRIDMATILSCPHVVVSSAGQASLLDDLLEERRLKRDILVRVTNFTTVPHLLERGDMIGIFTTSTSNVLARSFGLARRPLPMDVGKIVTSMAWHARNDRDKRHEWLRRQLKAICRAIEDGEVSRDVKVRRADPDEPRSPRQRTRRR